MVLVALQFGHLIVSLSRELGMAINLVDTGDPDRTQTGV
jgi:hypothetical protein